MIGLITGRKRGCFFAMFMFIFLPTVALTTLVIILIATGTMEEWARELQSKQPSQ